MQAQLAGDEEWAPDVIFMDNCCAHRQTLQRIFGADVPVKLDCFHFQQRFAPALAAAKGSPQYKTFWAELTKAIYMEAEPEGALQFVTAGGGKQKKQMRIIPEPVALEARLRAFVSKLQAHDATPRGRRRRDCGQARGRGRDASAAVAAAEAAGQPAPAAPPGVAACTYHV